LGGLGCFLGFLGFSGFFPLSNGWVGFVGGCLFMSSSHAFQLTPLQLKLRDLSIRIILTPRQVKSSLNCQEFQCCKDMPLIEFIYCHTILAWQMALVKNSCLTSLHYECFISSEAVLPRCFKEQAWWFSGWFIG
jgi:hypothetical protein